MRRITLLVVSAVAFAAAANAQIRGVPPWLDYYFLGGYPYGGYYGGYYGNGRIVTALVAGAVGGLVVDAISHRRDNREREYVRTPDGGRAYYTYNAYAEPQPRQVIFVAPKPQKPQKPLDCSKPVGKRGRNEAACAAVEDQIKAAKEAAKQEAQQREAERLAKRLYNRTSLPLDVFDCGKLVFALRVNQSTLAPEAKCGYIAQMLVPDRDTAGLTVRIKADFRLASDKSGWVFTAPKEVK